MAERRRPRSSKVVQTAAGTLAILLGLSVVAYGLYTSGYIRLNYPSTKTYPVRGLDVTGDLGAVDWKALGGVDFAFIRASEGRNLRDTFFRRNWLAARGRVARGAYHVFTFCADGAAQADNLVAAVPFKDGELPPAVDIEFAGNCQSPPADDVIRTNLVAFLHTLAKHKVPKPVLYVTPESYERIVQGRVKGYPLWVRDVVFRPSPEAYPGLTFWQYAGNGRVAGIGPLVDLDVFFGSADAFRHTFPRSHTQ